MKQIPDQLQRQIWATEQEILDVIHQVCTEYGLRYSLAYGTLIGAVRHKGFIPWDDDIDLIMPREDYEKLLAIWNEATPKGYILQNTRTDPDFTQNLILNFKQFFDLTLCNSANGGKACVYRLSRHLLYGKTTRI